MSEKEEEEAAAVKMIYCHSNPKIKDNIQYFKLRIGNT
jgi:hypothetical protein